MYDKQVFPPGRVNSRPISLTMGLLVLALAVTPAHALVALSGSGTVPLAPAQLKSGDDFRCLAGGLGELAYPDGAAFRLRAGTEGQIMDDGMRLKQGEVWMVFKKRARRFTVETPIAVLGVTGTAFGLTVTRGALRVVLVDGGLSIEPRTAGAKNVALTPGKTWDWSNGQGTVRDSTTGDLQSWRREISALTSSGSRGKSPDGPVPSPPLHDQFLYGMIRIESGTATVTPPPGRSASGRAAAGRLIPTGATVTTPANAGVELSLACGSRVRLSPGSQLVTAPFALRLEKGAVLARHVGAFYPMKITGAATLLISRDSVVEVQREGDRFVARVHAGALRTPGVAGKTGPGEAIEAVGATAHAVDLPPEPKEWSDPRVAPVPTTAAPAGELFGAEGGGILVTGDDEGGSTVEVAVDVAVASGSEPVGPAKIPLDGEPANPSGEPGDGSGDDQDMKGALGP